VGNVAIGTVEEYSICSHSPSLLSDVEQKTESLPSGVLTPVVAAEVRTRSRCLSAGIGVSAAMMDRLLAGDSTVLGRAWRRAKVRESEAGGSGKEKARRSRLAPLVMTGLSIAALPLTTLRGTVQATVGNARKAGRTSGDLLGDSLPPLEGELYMPAGRGEVNGAEVDDEAAP
jgi:hypothetical protein